MLGDFRKTSSSSVPPSVTRFGEILPTLEIVYNYFAMFLQFVSIWQHLEPTLAIFTISIGQIFMVVKAKYWKIMLTSGHTGATSKGNFSFLFS